MKIKKGDNVIMLGGKDRGKKGKITHVFNDSDKVVVDGLNLIKKHLRARKQGQKGQIVSKERAVSVSSIALVCKACSKPTRLGYKIEGDLPAGRQGIKIRVCKKCGSET